jgi:hypothetical protein
MTKSKAQPWIEPNPFPQLAPLSQHARMEAREVEKLESDIGALMIGHRLSIEGTALIGAVRTWIGKLVVPGDEKATKEAREGMLQMLVDEVQKVIAPP